MSDKEFFDKKIIKCMVLSTNEHQGAKVKFHGLELEVADEAFPDHQGIQLEANCFRPCIVGQVYPFTFTLTKKGGLGADRPKTTEDEKEELAAQKAAKKEADRLKAEQEARDYAADNAKRGISPGGGDTQADSSAGGAMIAPSEKHSVLAKKYGFTAGDVLLMEQNKIVPPNTPITQVEFFFRTAELMQLNPLLKQVYLLPFGFGTNKGYAIVVAIDSMRAKAIATGQYGGKSKILFDGLTMAEWIKENGNVRKYDKREIPKSGGGKTWNETEHHLIEGRFPATASVEVIRIIDGKPYVFEAEIAWDEYYPGVSGRGQMWRDRPFGQLGKCCEAIAIRMAFADALGKMHIAEEFDKKAAESEVLDVPHVDWDEILKGVSKCTTTDEVMQHKSAHPQFANDGAYLEAIQNKLDEINRGE